MKFKHFIDFIIISVFLIFYVGCAKQVDIEAEKATVKANLEKCFVSIQNQDWETLEGMFTKDWQHYMHMGLKWDLEATKEFFTAHIKGHKTNVSNIEVNVSNDASMAWAKFDEETEYMFDDQSIQENAIFTAVFQKEGTEWLMSHLHRTVHQPMPSEDAMMD